MDPQIDDVMQEQVGEDRADARPLRGSYLSRLPLSAFQDACLEPPLDETENSPVGDPVSQHPHQPPVVYGVEEAADVWEPDCPPLRMA
jgi:hypothetical protein